MKKIDSLEELREAQRLLELKMQVTRNALVQKVEILPAKLDWQTTSMNLLLKGGSIVASQYLTKTLDQEIANTFSKSDQAWSKWIPIALDVVQWVQQLMQREQATSPA